MGFVSRKSAHGVPLIRTTFSRLESSRRVNITRRPQPLHSRPMSAPSRVTVHSYEPHGCGLRRRRRSLSLQVRKHEQILSQTP